jgi:hypothetical protein
MEQISTRIYAERATQIDGLATNALAAGFTSSR